MDRLSFLPIYELECATWRPTISGVASANVHILGRSHSRYDMRQSRTDISSPAMASFAADVQRGLTYGPCALALPVPSEKRECHCDPRRELLALTVMCFLVSSSPTSCLPDSFLLFYGITEVTHTSEKKKGTVVDSILRV